MRLRYLVGVLLVLVFTAGWAAAQMLGVEKVTPTIITGENVGFIVEGRRGATPVGRIVIRVDGRWVPAELSVGTQLLSKR